MTTNTSFYEYADFSGSYRLDSAAAPVDQTGARWFSVLLLFLYTRIMSPQFRAGLISYFATLLYIYLRPRIHFIRVYYIVRRFLRRTVRRAIRWTCEIICLRAHYLRCWFDPLEMPAAVDHLYWPSDVPYRNLLGKMKLRRFHDALRPIDEDLSPWSFDRIIFFWVIYFPFWYYTTAVMLFRAVIAEFVPSLTNRDACGPVSLGIYIWLRKPGSWLLPKPEMIAVGSKIHDALNTVIRFDYDLRSAFLKHIRAINVPIPEGHSHPLAASVRTGSRQAMADLLEQVGLTAYHVSPAKSLAVHEHGCRLYYMTRDLAQPYRFDEIHNSDAFVMCDVDYYTDINKYLMSGKPVLMYTFVPPSAGGQITNGRFSIIRDTIHYFVSGGGEYVHPVWDYNRAHCSVLDPNGGLITYDIENQILRDAPERRMVQFTPTSYVVAGVWQALGLQPEPIRRLKMSIGDYNIVKIRHENETTYAFSRSGEENSVVIDERKLASAVSRLNYAGKSANIGHVERLIGAADSDYAATVVFDCYMTDRTRFCQLVNLPAVVDSSILSTDDKRPEQIHFRALADSSKLTDPTGPAVAVHPPLTDRPAVVPANCYSNDKCTINGRILAVANNKTPPFAYSKYAEEFRNLVVPREAIGIPYSTQEVVDHQQKPNQIRRNQVELPLFGVDALFELRSFQKAEAYNKAGPPRNITTTPTEHQISLSRYTLSMKENCLKRYPWFCGGKNPRAVVERVRTIAQRNDELCSRDFSKFDGTISEWLYRHVTRPITMAYFRESFRKDLGRLLDRETCAPGKTKHGVRYNTNYTRLSGSPVTSDHNTLINAFVSFCVGRLAGHSPSDAFAHLGIYLGDDAIDGIRMGPPELHAQVCEAIGLKVKLDVYRRGQCVNFLGRYFLDPWTSNTTFQDPLRTIPKLHLVVRGIATPEVALANKAAGYIITDGETPVIGAWAAAVLRLVRPDPNNCDAEDAMRRLSGPWPNDGEDLMPAVARLLDIDITTIHHVEDALERAIRLRDFPAGWITINHLIEADPPGFVYDNGEPMNMPQMPHKPASTKPADASRTHPCRGVPGEHEPRASAPPVSQAHTQARAQLGSQGRPAPQRGSAPPLPSALAPVTQPRTQPRPSAPPLSQAPTSIARAAVPRPQRTQPLPPPRTHTLHIVRARQREIDGINNAVNGAV